MMPSSFGCSPGTYGDRRWMTELQNRLMICDPTADLITLGYAKPGQKSARHAVPSALSEAEVPDCLPGRLLHPGNGDRTPRMPALVARSDSAIRLRLMGRIGAAVVRSGGDSKKSVDGTQATTCGMDSGPLDPS